VLSGLYILILALRSSRPQFPCLEKVPIYTDRNHTTTHCVAIDNTLEIVYIRIMVSLQSYSVHGNRYCASSNPFAISVDGRASRSCAISVRTEAVECLSEAPDVPSTPRDGIRCHRRTLGHQRSNWTSFELSTPMPRKRNQGTFGGRVPPSCCPQRALPRPANASSASGTGIQFGPALPLRSAALRSQRFGIT